MKILGIIQARIGSTRLPNKVLLDLEGKSVLEHVILRLSRSKLISEVVVATTIKKQDLAIVRLCANRDFSVFCGSENDVLDRFYQVAKLFEPDHIVRITADCPLMDREIIDKVIQKHLAEDTDYTANILEATFPDGEDVEVFKFKTLIKAWRNASLSSEREHVTPYIRKHQELFKQANLVSLENLSTKRWTLDNKEDYEFIREIYKYLYNHKISYQPRLVNPTPILPALGFIEFLMPLLNNSFSVIYCRT